MKANICLLSYTLCVVALGMCHKKYFDTHIFPLTNIAPPSILKIAVGQIAISVEF